MSDRPRRTDKSRRNRRILISAIAIFLVLISILAYVSSLHQPVEQNGGPTAKQASSKYFVISDLAGTYVPPSSNPNATEDNPGSAVRINFFSFNFTPVRGDANDVRIFVEGMDDPTQHRWEGTRILNGTSTYSGEIQPTFSLLSQRQGNGNYTLTIRIAAKEADGDVVLSFAAGKNLFSAGAG